MLKNALLFLFGIVCSFSVTAQASTEMSKENKKKLKTELKSYLSNLDEYYKEQEEKKIRLRSAEKELNDIKTGLRVEQRDLEHARDSVTYLLNKLEQLKEENLTAKNNSTSDTSANSKKNDCNNMPSKGTFYKVQIGNYGSFTASGFEGSKLLTTDVSSNGTKKFMVGYFNSLEDARKFTEDIIKIGIKDAFVAQYKDGARNESFDSTKEK